MMSIDDSVFKPSPEVSLTYFVTYNAVELSWTNSITDADLTLCGPLEYKIKDVTSGSAIELTGDPFTT